MSIVIRSSIDVMTEVHKKFPNAKAVPVCAWDILYNIYEDDTYENQVAQTKYYPREAAGSLNYSHELIWQAA